MIYYSLSCGWGTWSLVINADGQVYSTKYRKGRAVGQRKLVQIKHLTLFCIQSLPNEKCHAMFVCVKGCLGHGNEPRIREMRYTYW